MLTYNFDKKGNIPLYEYLYQCIKKDILQGQLKANKKLPSKRSIASHLGLSVMTVEKAYEQLIVEGYIYGIERKGYYVSTVEIGNINTATRKIAKKKIKEEEDWVFDFKTNNISAGNFPFTTWSKLMREVLSEEDTKLLSPISYNGVENLREAIADYLYEFRGMNVSSDQIVIGAGTEYLINLLIQFFGKDKIYGVENPGYKIVAKIYKSNEVEYKYINMDEYGLSVDDLEESDVSIIHTTPSHHFPTGIVMPIARCQELLNWANKKEDRYIIEDDYDSEFRLTGRPIPTLQSIDDSQKVIYINTFTKSIAPSIRISYMVLPPKLLGVYKEKLGFYSCTVPSFEQYTLAKLVSEGYFEKHINRMKKYYRTQRDFVIKSISKSKLGHKIEIREENSGLHFLLKVDTDKSDMEIIYEAEKAGIKLSCLSDYLHRPDTRYDNTIIINYSGIDSKKLDRVIEILTDIL